jgi:hypothetical protein
MAISRSIRCYAGLLRLLPRSFREEFGYEMVCDFADAMNRAIATGSVVSVGLVWTNCLSDLVGNAAVQWIRTGIPALMCLVLSMSWTLLLFGLLAIQGIPPNRPEFADLHVAWLALAFTLAGLSIACGRYHARHH